MRAYDLAGRGDKRNQTGVAAHHGYQFHSVFEQILGLQGFELGHHVGVHAAGYFGVLDDFVGLGESEVFFDAVAGVQKGFLVGCLGCCDCTVELCFDFGGQFVGQRVEFARHLAEVECFEAFAGAAELAADFAYGFHVGFYFNAELLAEEVDEFDCGCFRDYEGSEREFGTSPDSIGHIAAYAKRFPGCPESADEAEENEREYREMHHEMLRDFDALVRAEPRFVNYMELIEKGGVPTGSEAMRECDISAFDGDTIVAMLIYIYREDRFCGYQEHFLEYLKDGTFKRWLNRLAESIARF